MALLSRREWLGAAAASAWAGRPPNILLIMCDQLGSHALGCYGGPFRTPNIDNLAEAGVRFTRAVCTTPLCSPARASFITGRYPHSHGRSLAPYLLRSRSLDGAPGYNFCERVAATPRHRRKVQPGTAASFMVLSEGWKYIRYADGEEFLYDLRKDPGETDNVAASRRHQGEKIYLRRELEAWLARTGYPMRRRAAGLSKNTGGMYRAGQAHTMCGRGAN